MPNNFTSYELIRKAEVKRRTRKKFWIDALVSSVAIFLIGAAVWIAVHK